MSNLKKYEYLPAYHIADEVNKKLLHSQSLVITAPPGAGKSTLLPLTLLSSLADGDRILMLEPRRLAARQIAERMAEMLGEEVGRTVGYRVRFENCVSSETRIEVLTEGILTRQLISDPTLEGVAVVIFDEFHERSISSDITLAFTREAQRIIRPDLKILIMSATIDAEEICASLEAPLIESEGKMFPVEKIHIDSNISETSRADEIAAETARIIHKAHREHEGDILAFLPGQAEIQKCADMLAGSLGETNICPLYGLLTNQQQKFAIAPSAPGCRKVVLATPIAETSLTIQGVRIVVDSGLCRKLVFSPQNALSHLTTVRISIDMADQRTGRAGRISEGVCYRLWSLATEHRMAATRTPEILDADLSPMLLDISAWGEADVQNLPWITPPPMGHVAQAKELLVMLGAINGRGNITEHGKALSHLPCHPRIAQMLISAQTPALKALACDIAALLESKDPYAQNGDADISIRLSALRKQRAGLPGSHPAYSQIMRIATQYLHLINMREDNSPANPYDVGKLIASAFPERIAKAAEGGIGRYRLASGDTASIEAADILSSYDWLAVAGLGSRIFLASPLQVADIETMMQTKDVLTWDNKLSAVVARRERRIGSIVVDTKPLNDISREDLIRTICEAAPKYGLSMFDFNDKVMNLQRRIEVVSKWHPELELPDVSTEAVLDRAEDWFTMVCHADGWQIINEMKRVDMRQAIMFLLTYEQQQALDRFAPTHILMPTGSRIQVEYRQGAEMPIVRVRLQECFGMQDTPRINNGRQPVLLELLSPGFKPVQLTQDLHSFWENTYFDVRKELRRRYPKHSWPDNPLEALPTRGVAKKT